MEKLDERGCDGSPSIVVEILSLGNSRKEMKDKFELYQASQVPEYWIVDPIKKSVIVYTLDDDKLYRGSNFFVQEEHVSSSVLSELQISKDDIFKGMI